MIRVELAEEPPNFDRDMRHPGLRAIREMAGEPATSKRAGRPRKKVVASREAIRAEDFPPFWRNALEDMLAAYKRLCAYTCLYIERVTGGASVDHMIPKSMRWDQVYEWSNYRLACALMNSRKSKAADAIDPIEVQDGWFALEFDECQVIPGPGLDAATAARINATIERLGLNVDDCLKARQEYAQGYAEGEIGLAYLQRRAPFIARELRRQGRLRAGDAKSA